MTPFIYYGSTVFNEKDTQIWGVSGCEAPTHTPNLENFPPKAEEPLLSMDMGSALRGWAFHWAAVVWQLATVRVFLAVVFG
jgi:hypothetical protein